MSQLSKGRQHLTQVASLLRQDKLQSAIDAMYDGLAIMIKSNLMKGERTQFEELVDEALAVLMRHETIKLAYPLTIKYSRGDERQLLTAIEGVRIAFNEHMQEEYGARLKEIEAKKQQLFADAEKALAAGDNETAFVLYEELKTMFKNDPAVYAPIGLALMKYSMFEDAVEYLQIAIEKDPSLVHLYNDIGVTMRKLKRFDLAEQYFVQGSKYMGKNPALLFNLGRVYLDAEDWAKALKAAQAALAMQTDFIEAQRMAEYATKKLESM